MESGNSIASSDVDVSTASFRAFYAIKFIISDVPFITILLMAVSTILLASARVYRRQIHLKERRSRLNDTGVDFNTFDLRSDSGLVLPITASIFLMLLFFYFRVISLVLILLIIVATTSSIYSNVREALSLIEMRFNMFRVSRRAKPLIVVLGLLIALLWLLRSDWILVDVIGINLALTGIYYILLPSLKVSCIALGGLFLYDIFWVFLSQFIFSKNVMVEVATQKAENPVHQAIEYGVGSEVLESTAIMARVVKRKLEMPMKLMVPRSIGSGGYSMFGLGDIVLPGMFIAFALRCDMFLERKLYKGYFILSLISYVIGAVLTFYISVAFMHAQPALLYIVPIMLIPFFAMAYVRNELDLVWKGFNEDIAAAFVEMEKDAEFLKGIKLLLSNDPRSVSEVELLYKKHSLKENEPSSLRESKLARPKRDSDVKDTFEKSQSRHSASNQKNTTIFLE